MANEKITNEPEDYEKFSFDSKEAIKSTLKGLPIQIAEMEHSVFINDKTKGDLIAATKNIEDEVTREVSQEKMQVEVEVKVDKRTMSKEQKADYTPTYQKEWKDKYTNDMQRQTEVNRRLGIYDEFNEKKSKADRLDKWLSLKRIELSFLKRIFRSAEALARLSDN